MANGIAQVTRPQLGKLIQDLLESPEALGEDMPAHDDFVLALAEVVADFCGGKPELVVVGNDVSVRIHPDDALPSESDNVWTRAAVRSRASVSEVGP